MPTTVRAGARLLTVAECADILRVSEVTIRRFINRHELCSVRLGRRVLIRAEDLDAFVDARLDRTYL